VFVGMLVEMFFVLVVILVCRVVLIRVVILGEFISLVLVFIVMVICWVLCEEFGDSVLLVRGCSSILVFDA